MWTVADLPNPDEYGEQSGGGKVKGYDMESRGATAQCASGIAVVVGWPVNALVRWWLGNLRGDGWLPGPGPQSGREYGGYGLGG